MKYTLAFTTYNSFEYMKRQLDRDYFNLSDGILDEIVIQDDCSSDYARLRPFETPNVRIFQNSARLLPLLSRVELIKNCKNEWIILMDSDNFLTPKSFSYLKNLTPNSGTIYAPGLGYPNFDFKSQYSDVNVDLSLAANRVGQPGTNWMNVLLNTGNYLIPKSEYLSVSTMIDPNLPVCPCEVLYFNYLWLKSGRSIFCAADYEYIHTQRPDSFYSTYCADTRLPESVYELYYKHK